MVSNRREAREVGEVSHVGSNDFFVSRMLCPSSSRYLSNVAHWVADHAPAVEPEQAIRQLPDAGIVVQHPRLSGFPMATGETNIS